MSKHLIAKLINQAEEKDGTYALIVMKEDGLSFTSDDGKRKSTKNYKLTKKEIEEYERTVRSLDERCILFSRLNRVEFVLRNQKTIVFEKNIGNKNILSVTGCKASESIPKTHKWFVCKTEKGAVAFQLRQKKDNSFYAVPTVGGLFGSFFEIEKTGLLFSISGELEGIKKALQKVITSSNSNKISIMSLFSVLPNTMDGENTYNLELMEMLKGVCNTYPLFKTTVGLTVGKHKIMMGTKEVMNLFSQKLLSDLFGINKYWLTPCDEGSREEYFIMDNGVPKFDREAFLGKIFDDFYLDALNKIMEEATEKWLRKFYIFCAEPIVDENIRNQVYSGLKKIRSIRDSKGHMRFPKELIIVPEDATTFSKSIVVKKSLLFPGGHKDDYSEIIWDLFERNLNIKIYSRTLEMEQMAESMAQKKQSINRSYIEKLLLLASFDETHPGEVSFSEYSIFPYNTAKGLKRSKASEIVIGKPYIKEGHLLSKAVGRPPLWDGLKKLADENEIESIIGFAERHGAIGHLQIVKQCANNHEDFYKSLYVEGKHCRRDSNFDYTIIGLEDILKMRSLQLNRLVWDFVISIDHDEAEKYLMAEYSANNRETVNKADSSLIKILRKRTWIKDIHNKLRRPADIKIDEISKDLKVNTDNPIIKALHFGSILKKRENDLKLLNQLAEKYDVKIVDKAEYKEFIQWKKG